MLGIFAVVTAVGCIVSALFFPAVPENEDVVEDTSRFDRRVWLVIGGAMLMALNQAMIFSFLERMGADRGLSPDTVRGVLITLGLVAMTPALLAAFLEKRVSAIKVGIAGALAQGLLALAISCSSGFWPYAVSPPSPSRSMSRRASTKARTNPCRRKSALPVEGSRCRFPRRFDPGFLLRTDPG